MANKPSPTSAIGERKPDSRTRITLTLPTSLTDIYEEQAIASGRLLEDEIAERLKRCMNHRAGRPLYFNDDQRSRIERITGHLVGDPETVLNQIEHAVSLKVDGIEIELPAQLQQRIRTRVWRGETYEGVVKREVLKRLQQFTGMLPE